MPRGDKTGPEGMGPMTGRGAGYCAGHDMPGHAHPFARRGFGRGWGRGWGAGMGRRMHRRMRRHYWRHMHDAMGAPGWHGHGYGPGWYPPEADYGPYAPSPEEELAGLKEQAEWLAGELDAISKRIEELSGEEE